MTRKLPEMPILRASVQFSKSLIFDRNLYLSENGFLIASQGKFCEKKGPNRPFWRLGPYDG